MPGNPARILAVEDTPSLRSLLQLSLTRAGFAVDLAENGQAALDMFLAESYDAVVMDIQMPVMDGLAAVARMRAAEQERARPPVPMLALTANAEPADQRKCLQAGFTGTIPKPFGREDLLAALSRHLGGASAAAVPEDRIRVTADPAYAELIPPFLDHCRRDAETMFQALERRDYAAIASASHRLTGSGASFGFQTLSDESRLIEAAAKAADETGVAAHLKMMILYLKRVSVVYP